jgi:hypothetical protein
VSGAHSNERITLPDCLEAQSGHEPTSSDVRRVVPFAAVPWLVVPHDTLVSLPLDSRSAFILSLVDGRCTVEMILDMSGMNEDETMDLLQKLMRLGVLELHDPDA